ncbi:hypothetical protein ACIQF6_21310 [Kitasatospora sp. NPDC092948]|uniref:hypothetical protein n=1 Tax=Kitasatospora sp. NPDC092948 TaxID=3364088 RepID=UPI003812548F
MRINSLEITEFEAVLSLQEVPTADGPDDTMAAISTLSIANCTNKTVTPTKTQAA